MQQRPKPVVLVILDGFGYRKENAWNAIAQAATPNLDEWYQQSPPLLLQASGASVGLPEGQVGNSEVGHMHIGAGRVIYQQYTRINEAIRTGSFLKNPAFLDLIQKMKTRKKTLHVMGLLSNGGVHSHEKHLFAFLECCYQQQFHHVALHLFTDGRDTPPRSALESLKRLTNHLRIYPVAVIASLCGRYYAMDRDRRWERMAPLYTLLTEGKSAVAFNNPEEAIKMGYLEKTSDEFLPPCRIGEAKPIEEGDGLFFFNFRADRARQLTEAFVDDNFEGFVRNKRPRLADFVTMTTYDKTLPTTSAYPAEELTETLGEIVSKAGLAQLRLAETEKYAHVTFFLNGGSEKVYAGEERLLIASEHVATYDLAPDMRALEITKALIEAIESQHFDLIICNYANADMIGHTGNFEATVQTITCLDACLGQLAIAINKVNGHLLVTADHGNAEIMFDEKSGQIHTAHTCQPVPLFSIGNNPWYFKRNEGGLTDLAPTVLALLNLPKPPSMTGESLLIKKNA